MNEQEEAKTRLKKQQQEIDHMKLRYLAAEEKQVYTNYNVTALLDRI